MEINKYMSPTEASDRWGKSLKTLAYHLQNEETMDAYISKGWAKYYLKPGGKRKEWIVSTMMMEDLYGEEPTNKDA
jgi:hypothetical protein